MSVIPQKADAPPSGAVISQAGQVLIRQVAFRFALDPTRAQDQLFRSHAGAARFTFNRLIGRASANLGQRYAEASYGIPADELTPALSWSGVSFINAFTQFKNGQLASSPINADGTRGLLWADQVSVDAFECANVNAAHAQENFSRSLSGRKGKEVGFPKVKARHKTSPPSEITTAAKYGTSKALLGNEYKNGFGTSLVNLDGYFVDIATTKAALTTLRNTGINIRGAFHWTIQRDSDVGPYTWAGPSGIGGDILNHP